jgi:hypothetical protein
MAPVIGDEIFDFISLSAFPGCSFSNTWFKDLAMKPSFPNMTRILELAVKKLLVDFVGLIGSVVEPCGSASIASTGEQREKVVLGRLARNDGVVGESGAGSMGDCAGD